MHVVAQELHQQLLQQGVVLAVGAQETGIEGAALGLEGAPAVLAPLLDDPNESARAEAVRVMGELRMPEHTGKIRRLLSDPSEKVRACALAAAGNLRDKESVPAALKAIEEPSARVRNSAAIALGKIGDRAALPRLRKALEDSDAWVRSSAAAALGEMGDADAVPLIEKAAGDETPHVRGAAAAALGALKAPRSIPALCALLQDSNPSGFSLLVPYRRTEVREEAAEALGKITGDARGFSRTADPASREEALERWRAWCLDRTATPLPGTGPP